MFSSFNEAAIYYKTVEEFLSERKNIEGQNIRISGTLVYDSIIQNNDTYIFELRHSESSLFVEYKGILPDSMSYGNEVVVQGTMKKGRNAFTASQVITKCPSRYEAKSKKESNGYK